MKIIMIALKALLGVVWLSVCMYFGISMFMSSDVWVNRLLIDQNVKTNPKFTGGEVVERIHRSSYEVFIHEPVYEGVFTKDKEPFVQVDFLTATDYPRIIEETLDITGDSVEDLVVKINTVELTAEIEALHHAVEGLMDKGSLAGLTLHVSQNNTDGLFEYKNKEVGEEVFGKGLSIRVMFSR